MTKIVINTCYGGFGLSHAAIIELARRKGITLHPFTANYPQPPTPITSDEEAEKTFSVLYYTSPEPIDDNYFSARETPRNDPDLISLVEDWGSERVSTKYSNLKIVEIPDDVEWEIEEYDGREWVAEAHRTWD